MIEIVAKAIYDDNRGITMELARSIAKVAIMAMREPTALMVILGDENLNLCKGRDWEGQPEDIAKAYKAMIDTALK